MRNPSARSSPASLLSSFPTTRRSRKGAVLQITIGLVAAGAVAWMGIASVTSPSSSNTVSSKRLKFRSPALPFEIEVALGELGLTPKVMTAAGFSADQTRSMGAAWASAMQSGIADYRAAQEAAFQASKDVNRLERLIQGGAAGAEDLAAFGTAQTALATARAQRQSVLDTVYASGTANLTGDSLALLNAVRTNHRAWDIPESYLGDARNERAWVDLRDALANDRIAQRSGEDPDPASHTIVVEAQSTPHAAAALANLTNLADIQAAWNTAMGN